MNAEYKNFAFVTNGKLNDWGRGKSFKYGRLKGRNKGVRGCWMHDMRLIFTPNADPKRMSRNAIICAETGWEPIGLSKENMERIGCNEPDFVATRAKKMIADKGITSRKDQVLVAMLILAVSPIWFRDGDMKNLVNEEKLRTWAAATTEYLRKTYGDRLISMVIHMDEQNPHASAYVVPLTQKAVKKRGRPKRNEKGKAREATVEWRLCAKDLFTPDLVTYAIDSATKKRIPKGIEPGTCSKMQDEYTAVLRRFGLDVRRGMRRSPNRKALQHETNKERYERLTTPIEFVRTMNDKELRGWAEIAAPLAEEAQRAIIERNYYQITGSEAQEKSDELERKLTDSQRELPVGDVIQRLTGLSPLDAEDDSTGPALSDPSLNKRSDITLEFFLPGGQRLGITNRNNFENLTPEIPFPGKNSNRLRGNGALDVVMFLTEWSFKEASEWLSDNFGSQAAGLAMAQKYKETLEQNLEDPQRTRRKNYAAQVIQDLETADKSKWDAAKGTLTETFKICEKSINDLHEENWINANCYGHLIFHKARLNDQSNFQVAGKIIIDPRNYGLPLHESGDNGFYLDRVSEPSHTVICASPFDALAIRSTPAHRTAHIISIGRDPDDAAKRTIEHFITARCGKIFFAENLLAVGRRIAAWITEHFGDQIELLRLPEGARNWVDFQRREHFEPYPPDPNVTEDPKPGQS